IRVVSEPKKTESSISGKPYRKHGSDPSWGEGRSASGTQYGTGIDVPVGAVTFYGSTPPPYQQDITKRPYVKKELSNYPSSGAQHEQRPKTSFDQDITRPNYPTNSHDNSGSSSPGTLFNSAKTDSKPMYLSKGPNQSNNAEQSKSRKSVPSGTVSAVPGSGNIGTGPDRGVTRLHEDPRVIGPRKKVVASLSPAEFSILEKDAARFIGDKIPEGTFPPGMSVASDLLVPEQTTPRPISSSRLNVPKTVPLKQIVDPAQYLEKSKSNLGQTDSSVSLNNRPNVDPNYASGYKKPVEEPNAQIKHVVVSLSASTSSRLSSSPSRLKHNEKGEIIHPSASKSNTRQESPGNYVNKEPKANHASAQTRPQGYDINKQTTTAEPYIRDRSNSFSKPIIRFSGLKAATSRTGFRSGSVTVRAPLSRPGFKKAPLFRVRQTNTSSSTYRPRFLRRRGQKITENARSSTMPISSAAQSPPRVQSRVPTPQTAATSPQNHSPNYRPRSPGHRTGNSHPVQKTRSSVREYKKEPVLKLEPSAGNQQVQNTEPAYPSRFQNSQQQANDKPPVRPSVPHPPRKITLTLRRVTGAYSAKQNSKVTNNKPSNTKVSFDNQPLQKPQDPPPQIRSYNPQPNPEISNTYGTQQKQNSPPNGQQSQSSNNQQQPAGYQSKYSPSPSQIVMSKLSQNLGYQTNNSPTPSGQSQNLNTQSQNVQSQVGFQHDSVGQAKSWKSGTRQDRDLKIPASGLTSYQSSSGTSYQSRPNPTQKQEQQVGYQQPQQTLGQEQQQQQPQQGGYQKSQQKVGYQQQTQTQQQQPQLGGYHSKPRQAQQNVGYQQQQQQQQTQQGGYQQKSQQPQQIVGYQPQQQQQQPAQGGYPQKPQQPPQNVGNQPQPQNQQNSGYKQQQSYQSKSQKAPQQNPLMGRKNGIGQPAYMQADSKNTNNVPSGPANRPGVAPAGPQQGIDSPGNSQGTSYGGLVQTQTSQSIQGSAMQQAALKYRYNLQGQKQVNGQVQTSAASHGQKSQGQTNAALYGQNLLGQTNTAANGQSVNNQPVMQTQNTGAKQLSSYGNTGSQGQITSGGIRTGNTHTSVQSQNQISGARTYAGQQTQQSIQSSAAGSGQKMSQGLAQSSMGTNSQTGVSNSYNTQGRGQGTGHLGSTGHNGQGQAGTVNHGLSQTNTGLAGNTMSAQMNQGTQNSMGQSYSQGVQSGVNQGMSVVGQTMRNDVNQGMQNGVHRGMQNGVNQGVQNGVNQGMQTFVNQGMQNGPNQAMQNVVGQSIQNSVNQGMQNGASQGMQNGNTLGMQNSANHGMQNGVSQGMQNGVSQGMQNVVGQSMQNGVNQGMHSGTSQVMQNGNTQGMQNGVSQGIQNGVSQGMQNGPNQGIQNGVSQGMQNGVSQGMQNGVSQGMQNGPNQGIQNGVSQGMQNGVSQGMQNGVSQGMQNGPNQGIQNGVSQGMQNGVSQGMQNGVSQGMQNVVGQGMQNGVSQGMQNGVSQGIQNGMGQGLQNGAQNGINQGISGGTFQNNNAGSQMNTGQAGGLTAGGSIQSVGTSSVPGQMNTGSQGGMAQSSMVVKQTMVGGKTAMAGGGATGAMATGLGGAMTGPARVRDLVLPYRNKGTGMLGAEPVSFEVGVGGRMVMDPTDALRYKAQGGVLPIHGMPGTQGANAGQVIHLEGQPTGNVFTHSAPGTAHGATAGNIGRTGTVLQQSVNLPSPPGNGVVAGQQNNQQQIVTNQQSGSFRGKRSVTEGLFSKYKVRPPSA
ncbi:filaggrin-2-like, partial [Haliotis asinina]|uniref:filaggrin-2-like n=1 Tax=Haliotis asinina TaxID=109174 RepID=UPI003532297D